MTDRILVDTNVLVYAYDRAEPAKQARAAQVLDVLATSGTGMLTTQVLAEFFVAVTRKIDQPLTAGEAYGRIQNYLQSWPVAEMSGLAVLEAVRGVCDHCFSFWDAQIWATARLNQATVVLSEDFSDGSIIEGVRFVNPFTPAFRPEDWIAA
jgi:predicted nucleic acid-binding protein